MFLTKKSEIIIFLVFLFCLFPFIAESSSLYRISDLIDTSWPATSTNHRIDFTLAQSIPPEGSIVINFDPDSVNMPGGFSFTDADLSVATSGNNYVDRNIASSVGAMVDGISFVTGTSAQISIDINPTLGISSGDKVRLELGNNAAYGGSGSNQIINALSTGVYGVTMMTYDNLSNLLDNGRTLIVMIDPVQASTSMPRIRGNGLPDGVLAAGTTMTLMSLTTNYNATCRYSSSTPVLYENMIVQFNTTDNRYHSIILSGLLPGQYYTFYVRCFDIDYSLPDLDDYIIDFSIAVSGEGGTGGGEGGGEGSGSGGGSGGGGSGSGTGRGSGVGSRTGTMYPYPLDEEIPPDLNLSGWAYPASRAFVLQDGVALGEMSTAGDGQFSAYIYYLTKGLYTFGIWVRDPAGNRSMTHTATFWIEEDTQTNVSNILIPPTIYLSNLSVDSGEAFDVSGYSTPGQIVEVEVYRTDKRGIFTQQADVPSNGAWNILFPTEDLDKGLYKMRARTVFKDLGPSLYSQVLDCGVGEAVEEDNCSRSDINKDGLVNLVDFSIMLFNWETSDEASDINRDGIVNLVDFSIMLYCWTG